MIVGPKQIILNHRIIIDAIETNHWLKSVQNQLHLVSHGSTKILNPYEIVSYNVVYVNIF